MDVIPRAAIFRGNWAVNDNVSERQKYFGKDEPFHPPFSTRNTLQQRRVISPSITIYFRGYEGWCGAGGRERDGKGARQRRTYYVKYMYLVVVCFLNVLLECCGNSLMQV